jgi:hypothetical protein
MGLGGLNPEPRQSPVGPTVAERAVVDQEEQKKSAQPVLDALDAQRYATKEPAVKLDINAICLAVISSIAIVGIILQGDPTGGLGWIAAAGVAALAGVSMPRKG